MGSKHLQNAFPIVEKIFQMQKKPAGLATDGLRHVLRPGRTCADGSLSFLGHYQLVTTAFWYFCSTKAFTSGDW